LKRLTTKQLFLWRFVHKTSFSKNIISIIITMAASGAFSFDFLPSETTGESEEVATEQESTSTQSQQERRPFAWISNLPELLAERAEHEIVFLDIPLSGTTTEQHQRHAAMPAMSRP
jgi:hypothetical protein